MKSLSIFILATFLIISSFGQDEEFGCGANQLQTEDGSCIDVTILNCTTFGLSGCSSCQYGFGQTPNWNNTGLAACLPCTDANCQNCQDDYSACQSCYYGYLLTNELSCVFEYSLNCASGSFSSNGCTSCELGSGIANDWDESGITNCLPCSTANCAACSSDYTLCSACSPDYFMTEGTCASFSSLNCSQSSPTSGCTSCANGLGLANDWEDTGLTACLPCSTSNCGSCSSSYSFCTACNANYFLSATNTCTSFTALNCSATNPTQGCTSCATGLGLAVNWNNLGVTACLPCSTSNCAACGSNYSSCSNCNANYFLSATNTCTSFQVLNCSTANPTQGCTNCSIGLGLAFNWNNLNVTACLPCSPSNCASCTSNYSACSVCAANYTLTNSNTCISFTQLNCSTTNSTGCASCLAGLGLAAYYAGTNYTACLPCSSTGCSSCSSNYQVCTSCSSSYLITTESTCVAVSALNCSTTNSNGCATCSSGAGINVNWDNTGLNACSSCSVSECSTCSANYNTCTACASGYYISGKTCAVCHWYSPQCYGI